MGVKNDEQRNSLARRGRAITMGEKGANSGTASKMEEGEEWDRRRTNRVTIFKERGRDIMAEEGTKKGIEKEDEQ